MGITTRPRRPPSHTAYFVALGGIITLFIFLCCYFFYFCFKRVKELYQHPELLSQPIARSSCSSPAKPPNYPVNKGVRDTAEAMAKLCKLPPAPTKSDIVFPTSTSPAMQRADTGEDTNEEVADKSEIEVPEKIPQDAILNADNEVTESSDKVNFTSGNNDKKSANVNTDNKVKITALNADKLNLSSAKVGKVRLATESDKQTVTSVQSNEEGVAR